MFALSLPKILLTLAVIAAVIFFYKRSRKGNVPGRRDRSSGDASLSMKACPRCGVYVSEEDMAAGGHHCAED